MSGVIPLPNSDAFRIEQLVARQLPSMLEAAGFAVTASEPCSKLREVILKAIRHFSKKDAEKLGEALIKWEKKKTREDLISEFVNKHITVHSAALTKFAHAIQSSNLELNIDSIPCAPAVDNAFLLKAIYAKAIGEVQALDQYVPKSKKFQKKKRARKWMSVWGLDYFFDPNTDN